MNSTFATWGKNYIGSAQFVKTNEEPQRTINQEYIPTERYNKTNVQALLKNHPEIIKFHEIFTYDNPIDLFNVVVKDSRGTLPQNLVLMNSVNIFYNEKFDVNLYNLYKNSAEFFSDVLFTKENGQYTVNQANFSQYEKYIYLISLLVYCYQNRDELAGKLDRDYEPVINWVQIRYSDSLVNILNGPSDTYQTPKNFIDHYNIMLSTAYSLDNIMSESKLSKLNLTFNELANFKQAFKRRANAYDKLQDEARQFIISILNSKHLTVSIDSNNNLVFDASFIDLGDVGNQQIIAEYNSLIVQQGKEENPPVKTLSKQLQLLFNNYSTLTIEEFSFKYDKFLNDLSRYSLVYLVFPGIITIERTIYGETGPGVLRIAGKFVDNKEKMRYEFGPNEKYITFIGSQTIVKNFQFYITDSIELTAINKIPPNNLNLQVLKTDIFNQVITSDFDNANSDTVLINFYDEDTMELIPNSTFLYEPNEQIIQWITPNSTWNETELQQLKTQFPDVYKELIENKTNKNIYRWINLNDEYRAKNGQVPFNDENSIALSKNKNMNLFTNNFVTEVMTNYNQDNKKNYFKVAVKSMTNVIKSPFNLASYFLYMYFERTEFAPNIEDFNNSGTAIFLTRFFNPFINSTSNDYNTLIGLDKAPHNYFDVSINVNIIIPKYKLNIIDTINYMNNINIKTIINRYSEGSRVNLYEDINNNTLILNNPVPISSNSKIVFNEDLSLSILKNKEYPVEVINNKLIVSGINKDIDISKQAIDKKGITAKIIEENDVHLTLSFK